MRLLLVEDDPMIGDSIRRGLQQDGFAVDWVRDGNDADAALAGSGYDAMLLDLGLPGRSGLDVMAQARRRGQDLPILVITARDGVSDRVRGLDGGADDYIVKPFDLDELAARLRAVLRRRAGRISSLMTHGPLALDPATREVTLDGIPVVLSRREFALLEALLERPGATLSRAQLEERLYGWQDEVESNAIEVHIHGLRRKLGAGLIQTLRGVGYRLAERS